VSNLFAARIIAQVRLPTFQAVTRAALSTGGRAKAISYVQPSVLDVLAGARPASAMDGCAE
jgi:hypothetical protein